MARYINGKRVETSADKKEAVESAGGNYFENIDGDYVQGDVIEGQTPIIAKPSDDQSSPKDKPRNYVENLNGERVERWYD